MVHQRSARLKQLTDHSAGSNRQHPVRLLAAALVLVIAGISGANAEELFNEEGHLTENDEAGPYRSFQDVFPVEANAGDFITLNLTAEDFNPALLVTAPDGSDLKWYNDNHRGSRSHSRLSFFVPTTGTYGVNVQSAGGEKTGQYQLQGIREEGSFQLELETADAKLDATDEQLNYGEYYDNYVVTVEQGAILRVSMIADGFSAFLVLQSESSNHHWETYISGVSAHVELAITVPVTGRYRLWTTSINPSATGDYDLTIHQGHILNSDETIALNVRGMHKPTPPQEEGMFAAPVCMRREEGPMTTRVHADDDDRGRNYSAPHMADFDGDGDDDLVLGDVFGRLIYYPNQSAERGRPEFGDPLLLRLANGESAKLTNW